MTWPARQVDLGGGQLLQVLRAAQLGGLLFQLQLGDLLAQRVQAALEAHALLVGRAQLGATGRRTRCAWRPAPVRARAQRQRVCSPACAAASLKLPSSAPVARRPRWPRSAAARFRWRAAARRAARPARGPGTALPAPGAPARAAARGHRPAWRSAAITASSSSAWRSCVWPAAGPAPRSAPRRWRGALPGLRAGRRSRPALLPAAAAGVGGSACWVRRSSSTCSWWARVCASLASRRAASQALRGLGVGRLGAHRGAARLVG
jgi:hypothetical protein